MFGSSSKHSAERAYKAMLAGLDPVERLMVDKDYAKQLAQSSKTCNVCHDLDLENYPLAVIKIVDGVERREATMENIHMSWANRNIKNCGFCAMISDTIKSFFPEFYWGTYLPQLSSIAMIQDEPILFTIQDRTETGEMGKFGIEVYREPHVLVPSLNYLGSVSSTGGSASSSETWLPFTKNCLLECTTSHNGCRQATAGEPPTRILDLDALRNGSQNYQADVRLIMTSSLNVAREVCYATLSHCWGKAGIDFKLTEARLEAFKERVPFANLPATHQDAIVLARKLGLQYLWIDSLCIVQDNKSDCEDETAMMGKVYSNAYLTIAAVSSSNSTIPFLHNQEVVYKSEPVRFYGPRLSLVTRDILGFSGLRKTSVARLHNHVTLYARRTLRLVASTANSASWSAPQGLSDAVQGPLSKRAWTLQERALASRIVHFTSEGVRFECPTHFKSEDGRISAPGYIGLWGELEARLIRGDLSHGDPEVLRTMLQRLWRLMLSDYAQRSITRRSDLLPALSGFAERIQELHGAEYLAGLWRDRLLEDLCWTKQDAKTRIAPCVLADETSVPSWSWASITHPFTYRIVNETGQFVPHCEVIRCTTNLIERQGNRFGKGNRFGQVISGELVLRGAMRKARLSYSESHGTAINTISFGAGVTARLEEDARLISYEYEVNGVKKKTWRRAVEGEKSDWDGKSDWDESSNQDEAEVWCLKIGKWAMSQSLQVLGNLDLTFIMVLGKSSRVDGAFERLGLFEKCHDGQAFDDIGGMEGFLKSLGREDIIERRVQSAADKKLRESVGAESVSPEANVMTITIV